MVIADGHPSALSFNPPIENSPNNMYFGPALRSDVSGTKASVVGAKALWVDIDNLNKPAMTFPPSAIVFSGHGHHCYWFLEAPAMGSDLIEELNQILLADIPQADKACWNSNRLLRVPGSMNIKPGLSPVKCELKTMTGPVYSIDDIRVLGDLSDNVIQRIRSGSAKGFRSRSERDWAVVCALVEAGATDALIERLFKLQPIGDKLIDPATPQEYLKHTIERARAKVDEAPKGKQPKEPVVQELTQGVDGYYRGKKKVSTFVMEPKILLDGSHFKTDDAVIVDVKANGYVWADIPFGRKAFTGVAQLDKECPVAAWQWIGHDNDVRQLLPLIISQLQVKGLPHVSATPMLGLHLVKDKWYFIGPTQTLTADAIYTGYTGALCWLPRNTEYPHVDLCPNVSPEQLELARTWIPQVNTAEVMYPLIGWYYASLLKPWLETQGYRFPILNMTGTRGAGKTTLLLRIMMPLFGQPEAKSYDANTTKFVSLTLLGSANAIPIAFSEFRFASSSDFLRYILLSYDTGHNPKGRGDLSTVDYPLAAPFSLDGEDAITDAAAQQRVIVIQPKTSTTDEGTPAFAAYNKIRANIPNLGGYFIQQGLKAIESGVAVQELQLAHADMLTAFPNKMPDRIRNNYTVVRFGMRMWTRSVGGVLPPTELFRSSIETLCDLKTGRSRTGSDEFVEAVVNEILNRTSLTYFKWYYDPDTKIVYFQLQAHSWWLQLKRREGNLAPLGLDAIRSQLKEQSYFVPAKIHNGVTMIGIKLDVAAAAGLDVPEQLNVGILEIAL